MLVVFNDVFHRIKLLLSSESCPQRKLPIPLQEADFHIVDFVPIKHRQDVGLCPGFRGTVSDQESTILVLLH